MYNAWVSLGGAEELSSLLYLIFSLKSLPFPVFIFSALFMPEKKRHLQKLGRMDLAVMFLQPGCLLWAWEGRSHRVVLMMTVEVAEQSRLQGGLAVLAPGTLHCSESHHHIPSHLLSR